MGLRRIAANLDEVYLYRREKELKRRLFFIVSSKIGDSEKEVQYHQYSYFEGGCQDAQPIFWPYLDGLLSPDPRPVLVGRTFVVSVSLSLPHALRRTSFCIVRLF